MSNNKLQVVLLDEAIEFIQSLPLKVQKEIAYNYLKIEQGIIDNELFKKLENSNIWEFRTISVATAIGFSPFGTQKPKRL